MKVTVETSASMWLAGRRAPDAEGETQVTASGVDGRAQLHTVRSTQSSQKMGKMRGYEDILCIMKTPDRVCLRSR